MLSRRLRDNLFLRNVSILAAGTLLSQATLLAATPLLTRLYSAADFGALATFTSVAAIVAILATGRYEHAISLADNDDDALHLVAWICGLSVVVSAVIGVWIVLWPAASPAALIGDAALTGQVPLFLIPLYTAAAAGISAFQYWHQRNKNYRLISLASLVQVLFATAANIALGLGGGLRTGLIWGLLIGQIAIAVVLGARPLRLMPSRRLETSRCLQLAKKYINFPRYSILSDLASTASSQLPPLALAFLFNSTVVGYFSLANRMLRIPSIVLTSSVANVFRNDAIDAVRQSGNCRAIYRSTLKKLVLICGPVYLVLALASPWLFTTMFGADWKPAGHFAQLICLMAASDFVAQPLTVLFAILQRQKAFMVLQGASFAVGTGAVYLGYTHWNSAYLAVLLLAIGTAICNGVSLFLTYRLSVQDYPDLYCPA